MEKTFCLILYNRGGTELKEIGLRREIKKLSMYQPEEWEPEDEQTDELEELEHKLTKEFPDYPDTTIKEMVQQIYSATHPPKQPEQKAPAPEPVEGKAGEEGAQTSDKKPGKLKSLIPAAGRDKKSNEMFLLNNFEALNVDIPDNREKFRAYFLGEIDANKSALKDKEGRENKEKLKKKFLDEDEEAAAALNKEEGVDSRNNLRKNLSSRLGAPP